MKKNSNIGIVLVVIIVILLAVFIIFGLKDKDVDNNLENNNNDNLQNNNANFDETKEKQALEDTIKNIDSSLGVITIVTAIDKYNAGGDYVTKKNVNLLEDMDKQQLFVMEQIVTDKNNDDNFVILDSNGNLSNEKISPTTDMILAYYPYDLFTKEYNKYFKDNFDYNKRKTSVSNNDYDNNKEYIYYENRRSGMNGLSIKSIDINSIKNISNNEYEASITLNYSDRLSDLLNTKQETAKLKYIKDNDNIKIESYILD